MIRSPNWSRSLSTWPGKFCNQPRDSSNQVYNLMSTTISFTGRPQTRVFPRQSTASPKLCLMRNYLSFTGKKRMLGKKVTKTFTLTVNNILGEVHKGHVVIKISNLFNFNEMITSIKCYCNNSISKLTPTWNRTSIQKSFQMSLFLFQSALNTIVPNALHAS